MDNFRELMDEVEEKVLKTLEKKEYDIIKGNYFYFLFYYITKKQFGKQILTKNN